MRREPVDPFAPGLLAQKGSLFLTRPTLFHYIATRDELEQCGRRAVRRRRERQGEDRDQASASPLEDAAEAHRALEARKTTGSTILTV